MAAAVSGSKYVAKAVTTNAPDSSVGGDASYVQTGSNYNTPWLSNGADTWYHERVLFPSGTNAAFPGKFTPNPISSGWNMTMEWHSAAGAGYSSYVGVWGSPCLLLRLAGGTMPTQTYKWIHLTDSAGKDVPLQYDHWYDISVHFKLSADPSIGAYEWWVDGSLASSGSFPTLTKRTDGSVPGLMFQAGHYRGTASWTDTVYIDSVQAGPTRASVGG
jgi:polysaccharide lyase-like protein